MAPPAHLVFLRAEAAGAATLWEGAARGSAGPLDSHAECPQMPDKRSICSPCHSLAADKLFLGWPLSVVTAGRQVAEAWVVFPQGHRNRRPTSWFSSFPFILI